MHFKLLLFCMRFLGLKLGIYPGFPRLWESWFFKWIKQLLRPWIEILNILFLFVLAFVILRPSWKFAVWKLLHYSISFRSTTFCKKIFLWHNTFKTHFIEITLLQHCMFVFDFAHLLFSTLTEKRTTTSLWMIWKMRIKEPFPIQCALLRRLLLTILE